MAYLLTLPNEALYPILEHLSPNDAVSFALICRGLHDLEATERIKQHRELQKTYTDLHFSGCHFHQRSIEDHPIKMLEAMYTNPSIRFYPLSLTFRCCANTIDDLHEIDWDHERAQTATARKSWMNNLDSIVSMMSPLEAECFGHRHTPEDSDVNFRQ